MGDSDFKTNAARMLRPGASFIERTRDVALFYFLGDRILIRGRLVTEDFEKICVLLKKPHTASELALALSNRVSPEFIQKILGVLEENRFLEIIGTPAPTISSELPAGARSLAAKMSARPESVERAADRLRQARLGILDLGAYGEELRGSLSRCGMRATLTANVPKAGEFDFLIIVATAEDWIELSALARGIHMSGLRSLLVLRDFFGGWVGPCLGTPDGPCLHCLATRRSSNIEHLDKQLAVDGFVSASKQGRSIPFPSFVDELCSAAVTETFKLVTELTYPRVYRGLYELDALHHRVEFHDVLPVPQCEVCGDGPPPESLAIWQKT